MPVNVANMTQEQLREYALKLQALVNSKSKLTIKRSEKGAVSVYGLGRFPVTLYWEQFIRLLDAGNEIRAFIDTHKSELSTKDRA